MATKSANSAKVKKATANNGVTATTLPPVLTLEEAASYLRVPAEVVEQDAAAGRLPGQRVGTAWRFLKAGLDEWLSRTSGRSALLDQFGAFVDDDNWEEMLDEIYARRGRSWRETESAK